MELATHPRQPNLKISSKFNIMDVKVRVDDKNRGAPGGNMLPARTIVKKNKTRATRAKPQPRNPNNRNGRKPLSRKGNRQDKKAAELAYAIANPLDSENVRIATSYGSVPTGVATLQERIALSTSDSYTPTTVGNCFVFRSALRSAIYGTVWPGSTVTYTASDQNFVVPQTDFNHFGQPLNASVLPNSGTRHGPVLWPGKYDHGSKEYGYLMNNQDTLTVTVDRWPGGVSAFNIQMFEYSAKGFVATQKGTLASGGPDFVYTYNSVPNVPNYVGFALGYVSPVGAAAVVGITVTLNAGMPTAHAATDLYYNQHSIPGIEKQLPAVEDVRIISASLMFTNTAPNITKQGQVAMSQIPATADFLDYKTYDILSSLAPAVSKVLPADNGIYGFLKPTHVNDFKFLGEWESATGATIDVLDTYLDGVEEAWFQIDSPYDALAAAISIPPAAGLGAVGYWTLAYKIEFRSNDQWRSLAVGNKNDDILNAALASISMLPQFHTNAFHISDITNWLSEKFKQGKELIEEHGPTMMRSIETVLSGLSLLATLA